MGRRGLVRPLQPFNKTNSPAVLAAVSFSDENIIPQPYYGDGLDNEYEYSMVGHSGSGPEAELLIPFAEPALDLTASGLPHTF